MFEIFRRAALAIGLAVVATAPLHAGAPGFAKAGTQVTWEYTNSKNGKRSSGRNTVTIQRAKGVVGNYKKHDGKLGQFVPACWSCSSSSMRFDKKAYAALWPLKPGKVVTVTLKDDDGRGYVSQIKVGKLQTVKLAFGSVEAYKITETMRGTKGSKYKTTYTSYWAPSIGWNVKYDRKSSSGSRYRGEVISVR